MNHQTTDSTNDGFTNPTVTMPEPNRTCILRMQNVHGRMVMGEGVYFTAVGWVGTVTGVVMGWKYKNEPTRKEGKE